MAMTIDGTNGLTFPNSTTQTSGGAPARAWVSFNTANPPTINASFNVSSVTYVTAYAYQINFTTAFTDVNYAMAGSGQYFGYSNYVLICYSANYTSSASQCTVTPTYAGSPGTTGMLVNATFFR